MGALPPPSRARCDRVNKRLFCCQQLAAGGEAHVSSRVRNRSKGGLTSVKREPRPSRLHWLALLALALGACNRGSPAEQTTTAEERRTKPQPIENQDCSGRTMQQTDVNNDGRPDVSHTLSGGKRVCTTLDMNFDGKADVYRFYTDNGKGVAFEQHDFDFDGRVDEQAFFEGGALVRKELDTNFDGLIDTWMWCKGALVDRAERSRTKPGRVDTYEIYEEGVLAEIRYDENSDGRPEKWEIFKRGSLSEVRFDTTGDGKADRTEPSVAETADQRDKAVTCDGSPLPVQDEAGGSVPKFPAGDGSQAGADDESSGGENVDGEQQQDGSPEPSDDPANAEGEAE